MFLPTVIGHRGAAASAPENTLAGLRRAAELGARMVEFDVKLSRDGVPILMHDDRLERTTTGRGPVRDHDLAALETLDAGAWFGPAFGGEPIPTLAQALALCRQLVLAVNIEIKPCSGRDVETAEVALRQARAVWREGPPPLVSSFNRRSLAAAGRVAPDWPRGLLLDRRSDDWREAATALEAATLHVADHLADAESLRAYRAAGLPVMVYTVNEPQRAQALLALGAAAVITDAPDRVLGVGDQAAKSRPAKLPPAR